MLVSTNCEQPVSWVPAFQPQSNFVRDHDMRVIEERRQTVTNAAGPDERVRFQCRPWLSASTSSQHVGSSAATRRSFFYCVSNRWGTKANIYVVDPRTQNDRRIGIERARAERVTSASLVAASAVVALRSHRCSPCC